MKYSLVLVLGLALCLGLQSASASRCSNCGLGEGTNPCTCSEFAVKASKVIRPAKLVDPRLIHEAAVYKSTVHHQGGCGPHISTRPHKGLIELLNPSCGPIAPRFEPIGDLCDKKHGCTGTTEVVPAYPGRPSCQCCVEKARRCEAVRDSPCSFCGATGGCSCGSGAYHSIGSNYAASHSTASSSAAFASSGLNEFADDEGLSFDEQEKIYNGRCGTSVTAVPADPVSLALAFGSAYKNNKCIQEGKLNFGQKSIPIDGSIRKHIVEVPEEKLIICERPIIEMKSKPVCPTRAKYEETLAQQAALEEQRLELESQVQSHPHPGSFISYKDLGYGLIEPSQNSFVSTVTTATDSHAGFVPEDDSPCGPMGPPLPEYRSGNVIVRKSETYDEQADSDISYEHAGGYSDESDEEEYPASAGLLARLRVSARAQNCGCKH